MTQRPITYTQARPGRVVRIRVSPKDCMAVYDILMAIGRDPAKYTFSQATKLAFASLAESARQNNLVPTRQGFEFLDLMGRFVTNKADAGKLSAAFANASLREAESEAPPLAPADPEMAARRARFEQLVAERTAGTAWPNEVEAEFRALMEEFF